jgi:hypothetical protein
MSPSLELDANIVPWSLRGSYLSVAKRGGIHGKHTPGVDRGTKSCNHGSFLRSACSLGLPEQDKHHLHYQSPTWTCGTAPQVIALPLPNIRQTTIFSPDEHVVPPADVCRALLHVYFDVLDHTLGSLFHRPSFFDAFEHRSLSRHILLGVLSLAARYVELRLPPCMR